MVSNNQGLSSRCISLLEEVKGLLEDNRQNGRQADVNVGASTSRQSILTTRSSGIEEQSTTSTTSVTSVRTPRHTISQSTTNTSGAATNTSGTTTSEQQSSRALQNFRSLFAPYAASSRNNWSRPPLAKKTKKGPFQVKETWTHEFFCLAETCAIRVPTRLEKINLQNSGLGRKKVVFKCNDSAFDVQRVLQGSLPKA